VASLITPGCVDKVTNKDYWEQVYMYAQIAIDTAAGDSPKVTELIKYLPILPGPAHSKLLDRLASDNAAKLPESERRPLWESLVNLTAHYRRFADADWAMPQELVAKIEDIASELAPASASLLYRRLFGDRDFNLFEENGDYEEQRKIVERKRQQAVAELIASSVEGVLAASTFTSTAWPLRGDRSERPVLAERG
jgi:hypothetical protein